MTQHQYSDESYQYWHIANPSSWEELQTIDVVAARCEQHIKRAVDEAAQSDEERHTHTFRPGADYILSILQGGQHRSSFALQRHTNGQAMHPWHDLPAQHPCS